MTLSSFSDELALKEVENMELISKSKNLEEVEKYKGMAAVFKEQMTKMWEECRAMPTREQMAQERQRMVLETKNKSAIDEIDEWKMRCGELEIRISELIEENSRLKAHNCGYVIEISDGENDEVKIDFKDEVLNGDGCRQEERFLSAPTPKKKCYARVITSDSEEEDTPIGKLKRREKAGEDDVDEIPIGMLKNSNVLSGNRACDAIGEDLTPCRRRLFPLGELERMNCSRNRISRHNVIFLNEGDAQDDEDDEDESLRGFIVNDSEEVDEKDDVLSHDLSDVCSSDLELNEVLARIRRGRNMKEWQYEADMLASFSDNPELCM